MTEKLFTGTLNHKKTKQKQNYVLAHPKSIIPNCYLLPCYLSYLLTNLLPTYLHNSYLPSKLPNYYLLPFLPTYHLPTYLRFSYLPTYYHTHLPVCLSTYLATYNLPIYLPTYLSACLHTNRLFPTLLPTNHLHTYLSITCTHTHPTISYLYNSYLPTYLQSYLPTFIS